jgi:hypothetical protein
VFTRGEPIEDPFTKRRNPPAQASRLPARPITSITDALVEYVRIDLTQRCSSTNASRFPVTTAPTLGTVVSIKPTHSHSDARSAGPAQVAIEARCARAQAV